MQAFAEGEAIECSFNGEPWTETNNPLFCYNSKYRIKSDKPQPKHRPFKSQEECWQEILKHQPFGWVKEISSEMLYLINGMSNESIVIMEDINSFKEAMNIYEFKDGTPFGIKEE